VSTVTSLLQHVLLLLLSLPHLLQLLFDVEALLGRRYDAPLRDLLAVLVIEDHSHGVLKILEFLRINGFDLIVLNFTIFYQRKQNVSSESLDFEVEPLSDLALLQALVNSADMLPEGRIIIIFDTVVRSIGITEI
jgi:hypothetical protein